MKVSTNVISIHKPPITTEIVKNKTVCIVKSYIWWLSDSLGDLWPSPWAHPNWKRSHERWWQSRPLHPHQRYSGFCPMSQIVTQQTGTEHSLREMVPLTISKALLYSVLSRGSEYFFVWSPIFGLIVFCCDADSLLHAGLFHFRLPLT